MLMKSRLDGGGGQSDSSRVVGGGRRQDIGEKMDWRNLAKFRKTNVARRSGEEEAS